MANLVNPSRGLSRSFLLTCLGVILAGCSSPDKPAMEAGIIEQASVPDLGQLKNEEARIQSKDEVQLLIRKYEAYPKAAGEYAEAQTRAASLYLLLGANYETSTSARRAAYRNAATSAEEALLQDVKFRTARGSRLSIPTAAEGISIEYYEALFLWATSVFYHFRDVATVPERIIFSGRLKEAAQAIELMMANEPLWYGGSLQFSMGIFYLSVPEVLGGDREKAAKLMNEAVGLSQKRLLTRWGRAKYLAVAEGDKDRFLKDLKWVTDQDLSKMDGPPVWNRYFQADAFKLINEVDLLF